MSNKTAVLSLLIILFISVILHSQDGDFTVTKNLQGDNYNQSVALDNKGNAVVVWENSDSSTYTGKIYAAFLKYNKKNGTFKVKNPVLISTGDKSNRQPSITYNNSENAFYCSWVRTLPSNMVGAQLMIRKLSAKGKPLGDVNNLYSVSLEHCSTPQIQYLPPESRTETTKDYEYAIAYRLTDEKDANNLKSELWMAYLEKDIRQLKNSKRVALSKHTNGNQFIGRIDLNRFVRLQDGSFLVPYIIYNGSAYQAKVVKVSSALKEGKTLILGETGHTGMFLAQVSKKYLVASWISTDSSPDPPVINQVIKTTASPYKKIYFPAQFGNYTTLTPLENGGAVQLVSRQGFILDAKGKPGEGFTLDNINYLTPFNMSIELPGRNQILVVFSEFSNAGQSEMFAAVIDLP